MRLLLVKNLTPIEFRLYVEVYYAANKNWIPEQYSNTNLANLLNVSVGSIAKAKSILKKKSYLVFINKKDGLHIIIGKDQVELYNKQINEKYKNK